MTPDTTTSTVTVKLPPRFYDDHRSRDCGSTGRVVRAVKSYTVVELDSVAYDDLLSDAECYAEGYGYTAYDGDPFMLAIVRSAVATLKRLRAVERPDGPTLDEWERERMRNFKPTNEPVITVMPSGRTFNHSTGEWTGLDR